MSFELALRAIELALALAILQRGAEHLSGPDRWVFLPQVGLAFMLLVGVFPGPVIWGIWLCCVVQLHRYQGPYNGGSDKMTLLIVTCLGLAHLAPQPLGAELAIAYLAVQLVLSYLVSGWIKVLNPDWRRGRALRDVFAVSAYPVSERLRDWADRKGMMRAASWGVIGFELAFPLSLLHPLGLVLALSLAACFHVANAFLFGLNRFVWVWISAYPALFWFQGRLIA